NRAAHIDKSGGHLNVVCTDLSLKCDMVLLAVGVKPNSEIASAAGMTLSVEKSIAVDEMLRTSCRNIFAAGDCADAFHVVTGLRTWIPLALRANRAGWAVGDNVCGKEAKLQGITGTAAFKVFDLEVARTGIAPDEAEVGGSYLSVGWCFGCGDR
ncbi:MAG: FAD/NAD(P)-binding oxidoreductase, partial [Anaerolineales bacterium]